MFNKRQNNQKSIVIFENIPVRRVWVKKEEKWYFSIIDIISILTQSPRSRKYWNALKTRLKREGSELSQKVGQLKLESKDGKKYKTDVADAETILRMIQSIPSPKAEPFKQWLAKVGYERLQETADPEIALNRARKYWQMQGRSKKWIERRMQGQEIRNKLTDYWQDSGVKEQIEYAKLTNIIHEEWSDLSVTKHKKLKGLKIENLRNHMNEAELVFTALAELSTRQIAETDKAKGYNENAQASHNGGRIAGNARRELEAKTRKKIVTADNFLSPKKQQKKLNE